MLKTIVNLNVTRKRVLLWTNCFVKYELQDACMDLQLITIAVFACALIHMYSRMFTGP